MNRFIKLAILGLTMTLALPVLAQRTSDYLKPSDYKGRIQRDGDFLLCWGEKVDPSFAESYEIQCWCNNKTNEFRIQLKVQNQEDLHVLDIDEELAYQIRTLIDAAVYSATNLPDKEWMQMRLEALKSDKATATVVGLDGTTFRFYNRSCGASCWSPGAGNNAALVKIYDAIYDAIGHKDIERIKAKLPDIKSLTTKYASLLQDPYKEYFILRIDKRSEGWVWAEY